MDKKFDISFPLNIPIDLLREFEKKPRLVIKYPWIIGIPVPDILVNKDFLAKLRTAGFDVMIVPTIVAE
ncbi:MAG: hypothetical protein ABSB41_13000 [Anaerolineales bacterium]|jgi:hypothetical protein